MQHFTYRHSLLLAICFLICQVSFGTAELAVNNGSKKTVFSTMDYFLSNGNGYKFSGNALNWHWDKEQSNCILKSLNTTDPRIQSIAPTANTSSNLAVFTSINEAKKAGCKTVAQIGTAMKELSEQFEAIDYPKISLFILTVLTDNTLLHWGPNSYGYQAVGSSDVPAGPPSMRVALMDQYESKRFYETEASRNFSFRFAAAQEYGPWNERFNSRQTKGVGWGFTGLTVLFLFYLVARAFRLKVFDRLPHGIQRPIFIIAIIYTIVLGIYLSRLIFYYQEDILSFITEFLGEILILLLILYWLRRVKMLLRRPVYLFFLGIFGCSILSCVVIFVNSTILLYTIGYTIDNDIGLFYWRGIMYICSLSIGCIFGLFAFLFIWKGWRATGDRYAQLNFVGTAVVFAFAFLVFVFSSIQGIEYVFASTINSKIDVYGIYFIYTMRRAILMVNAIMGLLILGLEWPKAIPVRGRMILYDPHPNVPSGYLRHNLARQQNNLRMTAPRTVPPPMARPEIAHFSNANEDAVICPTLHPNHRPNATVPNAVPVSITPPSAAHFNNANGDGMPNPTAHSNYHSSRTIPGAPLVLSPVSDDMYFYATQKDPIVRHYKDT
ncbi:hypothetical protein BDF19DRAFT_444722 [Syncephalis fuscata]|nr:hypothetical protein BDF19DRAFT_444722 [Syncephalis fuscata]